MKNRFDIIINGGGPAGLSAACGLARLGLNIAIIEPQSLAEISSNKNDKRTTALSYFSVNYFKSIGLWAELSKQAGAINDIEIIDSDFVRGDSPLDLAFSKDDIRAKIGEDVPMGYILENYFFKDCLLQFCLSQPNIKFFEGETIAHMEQNSSFVEVELSSDAQLQAKLLIGADGRNSAVREMLGIPVTERDYGQTAITLNIQHEKPHNQTAIERFMPSGPFAILPMFDVNRSSIVFTIEKDSAVHYMKMSDEEFKSELAKRMMGALGDFSAITTRTAYPLKLKYSKEYFKGRCVLIADAAHAIHPIAGQGFNQGCKDIALLVELLKQNLELGLDIGDGAMLDKYQRERALDNRQMIFATNFFTYLFSNDRKIVTIARRIGIKAVDKINPIKKFFIKKAMGA
jgi:2-octaprenyl-6-methoxyphenol hydroxylase